MSSWFDVSRSVFTSHTHFTKRIVVVLTSKLKKREKDAVSHPLRTMLKCAFTLHTWVFSFPAELNHRRKKDALMLLRTIKTVSFHNAFLLFTLPLFSQSESKCKYMSLCTRANKSCIGSRRRKIPFPKRADFFLWNLYPLRADDITFLKAQCFFSDIIICGILQCVAHWKCLQNARIFQGV